MAPGSFGGVSWPPDIFRLLGVVQDGWSPDDFSPLFRSCTVLNIFSPNPNPKPNTRPNPKHKSSE